MDYENQDSILATVKKMLGIEDNYSPFDMDIIVLINSALMSLQQLGVGPKDGFMITDYTQTWKQFLTNEVKLEAVKMYVYLKVRVTFDSSSLSSSTLSAYERQIQELEWRLNVQAESVEGFDFIHQDTGYSGGSGSHTTTINVEVGLEGESAVIGKQTPSGSELDSSVNPIVQVPVTVTSAAPTRDPVERAMADEPVVGIPQFEYAVNGENLQLFMPGFGI